MGGFLIRCASSLSSSMVLITALISQRPSLAALTRSLSSASAEVSWMTFIENPPTPWLKPSSPALAGPTRGLLSLVGNSAHHHPALLLSHAGRPIGCIQHEISRNTARGVKYAHVPRMDALALGELSLYQNSIYNASLL